MIQYNEFFREKFLFNTIPKNQIKYISQLKQKKNRTEEKKFLVEGEKNVIALYHNTRYIIETLIIHPSFLAKHKKIIQSLSIKKIWLGDAVVLSRLGHLTTNYQIIAVVKMPIVEKLIIPKNSCTLVLDNIQDPGNLGTILRTACWYGIQTVICSKNTVELYNPKVIQASMGAIAQLSVHYVHLSNFFTQHNTLPILGACPQGTPLTTIDLPDSFFLVIGNESHGIHPEHIPYIHQKIAIPKYGIGNSLNAGIATAVICHHWRIKQTPLI